MYDEESRAIGAKIAAIENQSPEYQELRLHRWILVANAVGVLYLVVKDFFA